MRATVNDVVLAILRGGTCVDEEVDCGPDFSLFRCGAAVIGVRYSPDTGPEPVEVHTYVTPERAAAVMEFVRSGEPVEEAA